MRVLCGLQLVDVIGLIVWVLPIILIAIGFAGREKRVPVLS